MGCSAVSPMNEELLSLYKNDRQEHANQTKVNTPEYRAMRARDLQRRERVLEALRELADRLIAAGVETKGVEQFNPTGNWYVAFRDPDNIQLENWLP